TTIAVRTDPEDPIEEVKLWYAVNDEERDFRVDKIGKVWQDSIIRLNNDGHYNIRLSGPKKGWKAYFIELTYNYGLPLKLTTGVKVLPDEYPYPPYESPDPKGTR
ncbi:MAG: hypothetical protein KGY69_12680, partial [Bacteroidales bacterium]|nr:hypothetical protein [Bacteroidales bacterium]